MTDLRLVLRITGDASGLKAEVVGAKREIDGLGQSGRQGGAATATGAQQAATGLAAMGQAGRQAGTAMAAGAEQASASVGGLVTTIGRAVAAAGGVATVGGALLAVARAGDSATQSLAQLEQATGSAVRAREVYDALARASAQTGVAVADSAAAFGRFAIAAREIGATSDQVLRLTVGLQRAAIASNASSQEVTSATLQLGQALASGVLQGDELRSVLEAMPALAEVLARELGVSIGEMRRLGSEGQLTADRVFPALIRATETLGQRMEAAPLSLGRAMGQLTAATTGFLEQLDQAIGLSARLAEGLSKAADALQRVRQGSGLLTDAERVAQMRVRAEQLAARMGQMEAEADGRDSLRAPPRPGTIQKGAVGAARTQAGGSVAGDLDAIRAEYFQLLADIEQADRTSALTRIEEQERAAEREAQSRRARATTALTELQETLDRRLRIQREAADREKVIADGLTAGAISPARAAALREQAARKLREELAALNPRTATGGRSNDDDGVASALRDIRAIRQEGEQLAQSVRTPLETLSDATRRYEVLLRQGAISQDTFNRALDQAGQQYRRTLVPDEEFARNQRAFTEIGRLGENAFDNVGRSVSTAIVQGQMDFRDLNRVGLAVASELTQAFLKLAILNPIKNAAGLGNSTTLFDVFNSVGGGYSSGTGAFYGSGPSFTDASAGAFLFHTGGVAGAEFAGGRRVPSSIFAAAPRFHAGGMVAPGEVPAILKRGEGVFTPEQMARLSPAGGGGYTFAPTINFQGDAGSPQDQDALLAGMRSLWLADLRSAVPGIVSAAKGSLRGDVRRMGADRALGSTA